MKLVVAVIKPFKLDDVKDALLAMDVHGMTVMDVRGFGRQRGHTEVYRGAEYRIDFVPKTRLDILTTDDDAERVAAAVQDAAAHGEDRRREGVDPARRRGLPDPHRRSRRRRVVTPHSSSSARVRHVA